MRKLYYWIAARNKFLGQILNRAKFEYRFNRRPKTTPYGVLLKGSKSMVNGNFEQTETKEFLSQIQSAKTVINIGANIGYYVTLAQINKVPLVLAFEPDKENFKILTENSSLNKGESHVILENAAVGKNNEKLELFGDGTGASFIPNWSGMNRSYSQIVEVLNFDDYCRENELNFEDNTFVLIDVEGHEYEVLQGMTRFLNNDKLTVMIEICYSEHWESENPNFHSIYLLFKNKGFSCYGLTNIGLELIEDYEDFLMTAKKTESSHNYVFTKE